MAKKQTWIVYILKCADNTFYTGVTNNLTKRLSDHNQSNVGAKYTRGRRPVSCVYTEKCKNRSDAQKREAAIKRLSKAQKSRLITVV